MMGSTGIAAKREQKRLPPSAPVHQDFLFVDAIKAKTSRQGRRNARSFVMQKARRERPWSTSKHVAKLRNSPESKPPSSISTPELAHPSVTPTPTPSPPIDTAAGFLSAHDSRHGRTKREICSDCQLLFCCPGEVFCPRCLLTRPRVALDSLDHELFDPFGTASVQITRSESELLNHFVVEMAPRGIAVDVRNKSNLMRLHWFGTALNNAGFMHSLLSTAALHLHAMGRCPMSTVTYHKTRAIEAINSAISNPNPCLGISDTNIGAVFNLLCVEESLLNPFYGQEAGGSQLNQREVHLHGLRKMLQMRGGLTALGSNRILQAFILWHATAHAIASFEVPYLFKFDKIDTESFPHPTGYEPFIAYRLMDYARQAHLEDSLIHLVGSVLVLIADLNVWFDEVDSQLDPVEIQNYSCVLECLLLNWLRTNDDSTHPLAEALCLALLIFTVRVTDALQPQSTGHILHRHANQRLKRALGATTRHEWKGCQDLLLWILTVGAINAEGSAEDHWFAYQTSLACAEFGICTSEELLSRLHLCGWVSSRLDGAVRRLWKKILKLRLEPCFSHEFAGIGAGPLQTHVPEPDLIDWQNMGWGSWRHEPGLERSAEYPFGRGEGSYELGMNQISRDNLYYMGIPIAALDDPMNSSHYDFTLHESGLRL